MRSPRRRVVIWGPTLVGAAMMVVAGTSLAGFSQNLVLAIGAIFATALPLASIARASDEQAAINRTRAERAEARASVAERRLAAAVSALGQAGERVEEAVEQAVASELELAALTADSPTAENLQTLLLRGSQLKVLSSRWVRAPINNTHGLYLRVADYSQYSKGPLKLAVTYGTGAVEGTSVYWRGHVGRSGVTGA